MKKHLSRFLVATLCVAMTIPLFGCGDKEAKPLATLKFDEQLTAVQVGSTTRTSFTMNRGGLTYKEGEKYGIMPLTGVKDTGAVFTYCTTTGDYFCATKSSAFNRLSPDMVNLVGLYDAYGKQLIPESYAAYNALSERYIEVFKATEQVYVEDDALLFVNESLVQTSKLSSCEKMYAGTWAIYDLETGKLVPGATGTKKSYATASGRYVKFKNDAGDYVSLDETGVALPDKATVFADGSYKIEEKDGYVYSPEGEVLFTYNLANFIPTSYVDGYYIATKYVDGKSVYTVLDTTGKQVAAEFDTYINLYGNLIHSEEKVYNFEGKNIIDGKFSSINYDYLTKACWRLHNDGNYKFIKEDGSVVYEGKDGKGKVSVYASNFAATKEVDGKKMVYSYADKDYKIDGYSVAPWIAKVNVANSIYKLVNTISGETLLDGYSDYTIHGLEKNVLYIYAKYDGGTDVYRAMFGEQSQTFEEKKADLLADLIATFKEAGITVSVNEETGELALDSSVLFGGDSAVLTDQGKTFLDKFIKAYTSIICSDKYAGFITKTMVEGHSAPVAGVTYEGGLNLSVQRATNVMNYCLSSASGLELEAIGYSNSKPVYNSDGNVDMAASRRVSFRFLINTDMY